MPTDPNAALTPGAAWNGLRKQKPIDRLMAAMDACAIARGEAQWTNGYRTAYVKAKDYKEPEADRLYAKQELQLVRAAVSEIKFRRLALRLLRESAKR